MSDSFGALWTAAHQAPLTMGFLMQEYWSGCRFPLRGLSESIAITDKGVLHLFPLCLPRTLNFLKGSYL